MSTGSITDTMSASPVEINIENTSSSSSEIPNNDTSPSDGRDLLHSLKGSVSFAKQCLGLLQNQMKHAMDTLDILQHQVTKAQSTIDKIERKGNKQVSTQKVKSVVVGNDYKTSTEEGTQGGVQLQGHRMVVIDSNGQPLYTIEKPGTSYGIPVQHQGGPCLCSSCTNGDQPIYITGHDHLCTEKGQQIIAIHPGQGVYPIDEKQVVSLVNHCQELNESSNSEPKSALTSESYSCQKKRKCSCPTYIDSSPNSDAEGECPHSPKPNNSNIKSNTPSKAINNSSKSTSPIASQLLQVIDVLQNANEDEGKDLVTSCSFTRSFRCENTHSSTIPFTGPVPHPLYTASGTGILAAAGRRARKQDISPVKKENQPRLQETTMYSGLPREVERDLPELMKVPPPVLAATLEPDFLVVPGNSYFADSPPSAGNASSRDKERGKEKSTSTREERCSSREGIPGYESTSTSLVDVKKERVEAMRSPSVSSMSQASEGSRSPSESSSSEKCASRSLDESKEFSTMAEKTDRISRRSSHEIAVRDKQKDIVFPSNSSHKHPNGDSSDTLVSLVDSVVTTNSGSSRLASRKLSTNSGVKDEDAVTKETSPLSPKRSTTRHLKVTPLNSITTTSLTELRRNNPAVEYMSNPGIVRISHATPMTSAVNIPSSLSNQSKTETPRLLSASSPGLSHDKPQSTRNSNSFVHNSGSESDLSLVTTYSVAQIGNDDTNPPSCTSPSKRPNILSRKCPGKKDIPQGIVVLVPTIEDAKQLIKSSGVKQGNTPVLVPQNVLNQFSSNGEAPKSSADSHVKSVLPGKRHFPENNASHSRPKRRHNDPLIID